MVPEVNVQQGWQAPHSGKQSRQQVRKRVPVPATMLSQRQEVVRTVLQRHCICVQEPTPSSPRVTLLPCPDLHLVKASFC
jgi:hypothetical protein